MPTSNISRLASRYVYRSRFSLSLRTVPLGTEPARPLENRFSAWIARSSPISPAWTARFASWTQPARFWVNICVTTPVRSAADTIMSRSATVPAIGLSR